MTDHDDALAKYRALRAHVRKDGTLKQAYDEAEAVAVAARMTARHDKKFDAYRCPICGRYHVGHQRQHDTKEPDMDSKNISIPGDLLESAIREHAPGHEIAKAHMMVDSDGSRNIAICVRLVGPDNPAMERLVILDMATMILKTMNGQVEHRGTRRAIRRAKRHTERAFDRLWRSVKGDLPDGFPR